MCAEAVHPGAPPSPGGAVLLGAGDRDLRLVLAALLEADGWSVLAAADAREVLARALAGPPGCAVLALPLPGAEPAEAIGSLRGLAGLEEVPVVAIAPPETAIRPEDGLRAGRDERLPPTFAPADVLAAVRRAGAVRPPADDRP